MRLALAVIAVVVTLTVAANAQTAVGLRAQAAFTVQTADGVDSAYQVPAGQGYIYIGPTFFDPLTRVATVTLCAYGPTATETAYQVYQRRGPVLRKWALALNAEEYAATFGVLGNPSWQGQPMIALLGWIMANRGELAAINPTWWTE